MILKFDFKIWDKSTDYAFLLFDMFGEGMSKRMGYTAQD